ncbi:MAG TPA: tetratricopeptide repeat protein [Coleofasciculaceae cyanobacterium]
MILRPSPRLLASLRNLKTSFALLGLLCALGQPHAQADPILDKAQSMLSQGRSEAATAIYAKYLQLHPTSLPAQWALAEIAIRRFEYSEARNILEHALAQHPESAETAAMLGRIYQLQTNSPVGKAANNSRDFSALADEHFKQALMLGPNRPLVLTYLAEWQIQQNDLVSADKNLQQALKLHPAFVPALQGQVRFYMKAKDLKRARDAAMHALELDPVNVESYFLVAQLLAMANRPAEAVTYALKSEQYDYGRMPERDYFLASQYERLGELEQAIQYYENLIAYTPKDASVWQKLGELYDRTGQANKSLDAYQRAMMLNPALPAQLVAQARENTRAERTEVALTHWRRLLALGKVPAEVADEAYGAIAGLHTLYQFYKPGQILPGAAQDMELLEDALEADPKNETRQMDVLKLQIVLNHSITPAIRQSLVRLSAAQDPAIAGEALFLLEDYGKATEEFEAVDGQSADGYIRLADRLLLDQELTFSRVFYQRAYELSPSSQLEATMKRIDAKHSLAEQRVEEGNQMFQAKDYAGAIARYEEAARIYRQWDNVYLRLGDACQQTKQWTKAKAAYDKAITLSPSLMDSPGFSKNYAKLKKKVATR